MNSKELSKELKRRNISGIYIMDTFPNDNNRKPTCVEDCQPNTRRKWMLAHDAEYLRNAIKELATSFIELTEYCYEQGAVKEEWKK